MLSRRRLFGMAIASGGLAWAGVGAARLSADPDGPKNLGRIADFDGLSLPLPAPDKAPPYDPALPWLTKGGTLNDASALSETPVYGVVHVTEERHVAEALAFARANGLKVSIAAVRHSMGGHAFDDNALVLDMRGFNRIQVDRTNRSMTVQPGATWHDIQNALHPDFAVKAMQSSDIFSVGGSISVNAHGMDHRAGSVLGTVRSLRLMRADGTVINCSRTENAELLRYVVGGYGLFGVILSAELDIVANDVYRTSRRVIAAAEFPNVFAAEIENDLQLGLFYGHLSTAPGSLLDEMIVYRYDHVADASPANQPSLGEAGAVRLKRLLLNLAKKGDLFREMKWYAEKQLEPRAESCTVERTAAMGEGEACLVTRNDPMHDSVPYLFNALANDTDILHEYFFPRAAYRAMIDGARDILRRRNASLLNASLRVVHAEDTALSYAREPSFSLVLYINQATDRGGNDAMRALTRELIDLTLANDGRFFLPYQLHYTASQLLAAYPELPTFLAAKDKFDPGGLFVSTWYRAIRMAAAQ
jgi:FAD/FMN-containing dehydrogenase